MKHVLLIGFMGSGKSTVGRLVAERFLLPFVDLDDRITASADKSISEIFAREGEEGFRSRERSALEALADEPASVVACGGGVVTSDANRATLRELGSVVYLRVSAGEALARIGDTSSRPLLAGPGAPLAATSLLAAREALYTAVADEVVDTENRTAEEVARLVIDSLGAIGDLR